MTMASQPGITARMSPPKTCAWPAAGSRRAASATSRTMSRWASDTAGREAGRDLGVRLVDQPDVGHGEDRADDRLPQSVHRRVVVVLRVALPRRCVQDRPPRARCHQRGPVQVELWPTDAHQSAGVELEQPGQVALDGGLSGHEDPVVGLGVVARHGLLVALTVVDVDVQPPTVEEGLEVEHRVVAVEHHLRVRARRRGR